MIIVLIIKEKAVIQGIGLMESLWKVVEAITNTCLSLSVRLNSVLYGFCTGRGTGTVILELKLAQELSSMYQYPLFLFLLDLRMDYDTIDCGRLLTIMEGYNAIPCM